MKKQLYAIFDQCAGIYDSPHFGNTDDIVIREFADIASAADPNPIQKHPEHYSLFRLAQWDNENGKIVNEDNICLCTALEAISRSRQIDVIAMEETESAITTPV